MVSLTLTALLEALHIESRPACFETLYPAAALEYAAQGCIYVQERFLQALDREFDLFPRRREAVYRAAAAIRENEPLARYTVLLDHQPNDYANEAVPPVDLVLSGHTHGGHIFPAGQIGLLTGANDRRYGTERRGDTDFVVTSGISGWAIPFKTGTWSEYVVIDVLPE